MAHRFSASIRKRLADANSPPTSFCQNVAQASVTRVREFLCLMYFIEKWDKHGSIVISLHIIELVLSIIAPKLIRIFQEFSQPLHLFERFL